jgi:hypothetical protein
MADALRQQFEESVSSSEESNGGITPLAYSFNPDSFQLLSASAELIFSQNLLRDSLDQLRTWASGALGTGHVSTPQVKVYINGCGRSFLRDSVTARWHYLLSLSRCPRNKVGRVSVLAEDEDANGGASEIRMGRVLRFRMEFNHLLVHSATNSYSVEVPKTSMDPNEGTVLLDGYFW